MNRGFAGRATVDTGSRAKAPGVCTCVGIEFLLSFLPLLSRSETERRREREERENLFLPFSGCRCVEISSASVLSHTASRSPVTVNQETD